MKNVIPSDSKMDFKNLVNCVQQAHTELSVQAGKAVNASLTLRNWLIGLYISEYELNGSDRADYGKKIIERLSIDKEKLTILANQSAEQSSSGLSLRDPYIFEFLGLKAKEVMSESHVEDELLNHIEDFLLELGDG